MALHGSQKKFDKNGNGKLSYQEWWRWYRSTYGVDLEREERRKAAQSQTNWNAWLSETARVTHAATESFLEAACELLPSTQQSEAKELAWKALLCQTTVALAEGDLWNQSQKIDTGLFVGGKVFYLNLYSAANLFSRRLVL